ncbi:GmrSD restriction endonuclease domain-containing protein [Streptomyces goshikiensis]|uniref:GmrSD restriction endonuclease domain-containing protein n=1 Tax=Streptomyces goshikiensis TaxID=1942 RepID=UPI00367DCE02
MSVPISVTLTVRSETIQQAYSSYRSDLYRVNRRYQRKLVWSVEEKQRLVDSILKALPLPLFLVAEVSGGHDSPLELIDGMQRMNAIFSFIDQEFDYQGMYFDLDTLADTKALKDSGDIQQKEPRLGRSESVALANYSLALSVFRAESQSSVDEVFRRINSGGRRLSRQELRQAGTVSPLADLVRRLASQLRGDTSPSDSIALRQMPQLSISNKNLDYGVLVENIYWVSQNILRREDVRQSLDEQVILDILIDCLIEPIENSSTKIRDDFYSFSSSVEEETSEATRRITNIITLTGEERIEEQFLRVYDVIRALTDQSGKKFGALLGVPPTGRSPRYFHALFLAFWEMMFKDPQKRHVHDIPATAEKMSGISSVASITTGGDWESNSKRQTVDAFKGIISPSMEEVSHEVDPGRFGWSSHFETLLANALVEQQFFDAKQGFYTLAPTGRTFDGKAFDKVAKTLTAIANMGSDHTGYVAIGVADTGKDAARIEQLDGVPTVVHRGFHIVGIEREAKLHGVDLNSYWTWIVQKFGSHPDLPEDFRKMLARESRIISYRGLAVGLLKVSGVKAPVFFRGGIYERAGSETPEVSNTDYMRVFSRFRS